MFLLEQNHNFRTYRTSKSPSESPASLFVTLNVSIIVGMKDGNHLTEPGISMCSTVLSPYVSCKTESQTYRVASTTGNKTTCCPSLEMPHLEKQTKHLVV